ncbi:G/U mismatch-specific uracil DNA glycosylase [Neolecta irregularis DAH-3]|uniref:G/U mismatch-specific uracil DNA glycosylase n=1 Tax=Neolecta irregularis (strain DAH-3) TaxID=1198029 RepID=A0A1U7LIL6_NEOID|nr:G/U mismatch-specific uracil DNA glycosylase [Neolecta irregularis DAH-3]|eukprot:OLL22371.1 G/U mismatch-specific uracil DNA glycosylase [Neolecta irregularis DAH-3]
MLDLDAFKYTSNSHRSTRSTSQIRLNRNSTPKSSSPYAKSPRKSPRNYAAPQVYAHLPQSVPDIIAPNLHLLIIGLNPGVATAKAGHVFSGPNNHFWPLLYESGITPVQLHPSEDRRLLDYGCGVTNIIDRPTTEASELSKTELVEAVPRLFQKIKLYQPKSICVLGKSIWDAIEKHESGRYPGKDFRYGWQRDIDRVGVFVIMSTSGRVACYKKQDKLNLFLEMAAWLNKERQKEQGPI